MRAESMASMPLEMADEKRLVAWKQNRAAHRKTGPKSDLYDD
jgi:hypothetical protein